MYHHCLAVLVDADNHPAAISVDLIWSQLGDTSLDTSVRAFLGRIICCVRMCVYARMRMRVCEDPSPDRTLSGEQAAFTLAGARVPTLVQPPLAAFLAVRPDSGVLMGTED